MLPNEHAHKQQGFGDEFKSGKPIESVGINFKDEITATQAKIVRELIADGRKTASDLSKKLGISRETTKKNYLTLEKTGIIVGATTHINYKLFGYRAVAHILICVEPQQADKLLDYLRQMPQVYAAYSRGVNGNIDIVATLKTLGQLSDIKDTIKKNFTVLEMKTGMWTDVKEMNQNLAIVEEIRKNPQEPAVEKSKPANVTIDKVDQKIADKLAQDGRIPMQMLAKEVGISTEMAKARYQKLRDSGALKVTIQIDPIKLGYRAMCVFFAVTASERTPIIIDEISKIPDIISIMKTAGDYDLIIWAMVQNLDQLLAIKERIEKTPGISKIELELSRFREPMKWPSPRQYISTF